MSDKLSVHNKEDIPQIIETIVKKHGAGIIPEILNELLNHCNHGVLRDIIKNSVHDENKERQEFFSIGLNVYKYKYDNECTMRVAVAAISEKVGIKDSTIRTHLENFRKKIKRDIVQLNGYGSYSTDINGVENFIDDFINELTIRYDFHSMKKREIKEAYNNFMESIGGVPF